jgi:hypothetical protein
MESSISVVETTYKELSEMKFLPTDAMLTVFIPKKDITEVRDNLYLQLEGSQNIPNSEWGIDVERGLKAIIKVFKTWKHKMPDKGMTLYFCPTECAQKVYLVQDCPILDKIEKSVLVDDRFHYTCP